MRNLGSTWLPFFVNASAEQNMTICTDRMNALVAQHDLQIINVETMYRTNWLGRVTEPRGLRVWWLSEEPLSAIELAQPQSD